MNKKKVRFWVLVLLLIGGGCGIVLFLRGVNAHRVKDALGDVEKERTSFIASEILRIFGQRIEFYGVVLDQFDEPVPGATVEYALVDPLSFSRAVLFKGAEKRFEKTDADGRFSISGVGGELSCFVEHPDYYRTDKSRHSRGYANREKNPSHEDFENPIVFRLHKKGVLEPLYCCNSKMFSRGASSCVGIPQGESIEICLAPEANLQTSPCIYMTYNGTRDGGEEFLLKVPGGGFFPRKSQFDFVAPENGYQETVILSERDEKNGKYSYFVKFSNDCYGLIELHLLKATPILKETLSGEKLFERGFDNVGIVRFQTLFNPRAGSPNLEYDYRSQINRRSRSCSFSKHFF